MNKQKKHKNHFISGLCSTDDNWPLQLWDQLAEQALITLNLLRTSHIDPSKSAYHQLHGHKYDWNAHPLAPPGSRAVIYLDPDGRPSWGARGADAWYSGPSLDHYRCMKFFVPETKNYRVSGSYDLFPQHCLLPDLAPADHADAVADELVETVQQLDKQQKRKLLNKLRDMIQRLTAGRSAHPQRVGTEATSEGGATATEGGQQEQRVGARAPPVTTTTDPTNPKTLKTKPRTHTRRTRNNNPGALPLIPSTDRSKPLRRSPRLNDSAIPARTPNSNRIPLATPAFITQEAIN